MESKFKKYVENLLWAALLFILVASAYGFIRDYPNYDDTDDVNNGVRSGMTLRTDYGTGCQYLVEVRLFTSTVVPRMDSNGNHVCKEKEDGKRRQR